MVSRKWKAVILAPIAASLLVACQNKSDDVAATPPSSPYQGFWVNTHTTRQIADCRGQVLGQVFPLDAIYIDGDGSVIRYTDRQTHSDPEARRVLRIGHVQNDGGFARSYDTTSATGNYNSRDYGYGMRDGTFANFDGNHMQLVDMWHNQQNREYTRTTETQLQNDLAELNRCAGQGYPRFTQQMPPPRQYAQMQPPNGMPPSYPGNVDPRIVSPGQDVPNYPQGQTYPPREQQQQQPPPQYRDPGGYPPPPEYGGGRMAPPPSGRF